MPYKDKDKDKDKQREAVKRAVRRHRAKGITKVLHNEGITQGVMVTGSDTHVIPAMPKHAKITEQPMKASPRTVVVTQSYNPMMVGYVPPKE